MAQNYKTQSLCWDCKKATKGCSWSDNSKPVEGWDAKPMKKVYYDGVEYTSYLVFDCPLFVRDAYMGGQRKYKE